MSEVNISAPEIIRRKQLETQIGLGRSAIYDRLDKTSPRYDPSFPRPIKLGGGEKPPVGWIKSEVDTWVLEQISKSRSSQSRGAE